MSNSPSDECGIVAQVSAPLAQAEISTYYICTYYTDHTLVSGSTKDLVIPDVVLRAPAFSLITRLIDIFVHVQVLDESANKALQLLNERYVAKVITCEKQRQANELSNDSESVSSSSVVGSSISTNTIPADPSPLIHSYTHPILINSHA